jgi:2-polyprenyl-3-methyl-5-hydroxy-6-metoxy-1,4-benzoquinol methylase
MIDVKAYGGQDVRKMISEDLRVRFMVDKGGARVCDLCCGVGMSTRALGKAFHDAELIVGVDTSPEMISMAKAISGHEQGVWHALARHKEGLKNLLGQKHKTVVESMTVIDTHPDLRHLEATYRLANAGESLLSWCALLVSNIPLEYSTYFYSLSFQKILICPTKPSISSPLCTPFMRYLLRHDPESSKKRGAFSRLVVL